jgi:hypothetical protein
MAFCASAGRSPSVSRVTGFGWNVPEAECTVPRGINTIVVRIKDKIANFKIEVFIFYSFGTQSNMKSIQ